MSVILGIDVGGSTTKIVAFREDHHLQAAVQVRASDQRTSLYGAIGRLLYEQNLTLADVREMVLTGVGATSIEGDVYGIPTHRVVEFEAIGRGGLVLSGLSRALVVSMGTGTAFVRASLEGSSHLGGSGIGGGTLLGLSKLLLETDDADAVLALAETGDLSTVDLSIREISPSDIPSLPPETTAANFGNLKSTATKSDLAQGLLNAVFQTAGVMAAFASGKELPIVVTGTLATFPCAASILEGVGALHGIQFHIPENAAFATAIGAASLRFPDVVLSK